MMIYQLSRRNGSFLSPNIRHIYHGAASPLSHSHMSPHMSQDNGYTYYHWIVTRGISEFWCLLWSAHFAHFYPFLKLFSFIIIIIISWKALNQQINGSYSFLAMPDWPAGRVTNSCFACLICVDQWTVDKPQHWALHRDTVISWLARWLCWSKTLLWLSES